MKGCPEIVLAHAPSRTMPSLSVGSISSRVMWSRNTSFSEDVGRSFTKSHRAAFVTTEYVILYIYIYIYI